MVEHKMTHPILSWLTIIVVGLGTAAWGVVCYYAIKDSDRHWNVGQITDTPARTIYSTVKPEDPYAQVQQLPTVPTTSSTADPSRSTSGTADPSRSNPSDFGELSRVAKPLPYPPPPTTQEANP